MPEQLEIFLLPKRRAIILGFFSDVGPTPSLGKSFRTEVVLITEKEVARKQSRVDLVLIMAEISQMHASAFERVSYDSAAPFTNPTWKVKVHSL